MMKSSNANRPILFMEKKKQLENCKNKINFHDNNKCSKIADKNNNIISISKYKRKKIKNICLSKKNLFNAPKIKNKFFIIAIIILFLVLIITSITKQNSYAENISKNNFNNNYSNHYNTNKSDHSESLILDNELCLKTYTDNIV